MIDEYIEVLDIAKENDTWILGHTSHVEVYYKLKWLKNQILGKEENR